MKETNKQIRLCDRNDCEACLNSMPFKWQSSEGCLCRIMAQDISDRIREGNFSTYKANRGF